MANNESLQEQNVRLRLWQWEKMPGFARKEYPSVFEWIRMRKKGEPTIVPCCRPMLQQLKEGNFYVDADGFVRYIYDTTGPEESLRFLFCPLCGQQMMVV